MSVFYPPLRGDERFDSDGSYEASGPIEKTDRRMFVKRVDEVRHAGKEIITTAGQPRTIRMLTKADGVGFGLSHVCIEAGTDASLWYKHHWQANHITSGTGEVTDIATEQTWELGPSMAYKLGPKDRHRVRAHTDVVLLSVFSLPLMGDEQRDGCSDG